MPFVCNPNCENIQIVQLYPSAETSANWIAY
jgi:hypothetical protein